MKVCKVFLIFALVFFWNSGVFGAEKEIRFDFEEGTQGWMIPDWAYYQDDHKGKTSNISTELASSGKQSLEVICDYPGKTWAAVLVEREKDMDLSGYGSISVDIYIPKGAPKGLFLGRVVLTVGDGWWFTEQRVGIPLEVGKWTTIEVPLDSPELTDQQAFWKGRKEKRLYNNLNKIRKIAVRVEYDAAPPYRIGPKYDGPIYVDNMIIK